MKLPVLLLVIIAAAVFFCGCTTPASPSAPPASTVPSPAFPVIPDITGTWTGPMAGYAPVKGFTNYGNATMTMIVTEQKGRIFSCSFVFGTGPNSSASDCSGIIGRDGKTLTMTQKTGGYSFGDIISPSEIELTYVYDGSPNSVAIDTLRKV